MWRLRTALRCTGCHYMINSCATAVKAAASNREPHCSQRSHTAQQRSNVAARDCDAADNVVRVLDGQANGVHGVRESAGFTVGIDGSMFVAMFCGSHNCS